MVPEGLVEDVLKTTYHFTEEQCRGLFAAVETLLQVETEYRCCKDLKATKSGVGYGDVWLLDKTSEQKTVDPITSAS